MELFERPALHIVVPGRAFSGNEKTRGVAIPRKDAMGEYIRHPKTGERVWRAAMFSTKEADEYEERVRSIAQYEVLRTRWIMPEYCWVGVTIYNGRTDRDNAVKPLMDALQGMVFPNDGRILDGPITRRKDDKGPRVEVEIRAIDPREYGY